MLPQRKLLGEVSPACFAFSWLLPSYLSWLSSLLALFGKFPCCQANLPPDFPPVNPLTCLLVMCQYPAAGHQFAADAHQPPASLLLWPCTGHVRQSSAALIRYQLPSVFPSIQVSCPVFYCRPSVCLNSTGAAAWFYPTKSKSKVFIPVANQPPPSCTIACSHVQKRCTTGEFEKGSYLIQKSSDAMWVAARLEPITANHIRLGIGSDTWQTFLSLIVKS